MDKVLSIRNLSIRTTLRPIVDSVSFDVGGGEAVLLSGANGSGKSSILHAIVYDDTYGKTISGNIYVRNIGDILTLKAEAIQRYRAGIAYVPQRDDYAELGSSIRVRDIISQSNDAYLGKALTDSEVNDLIDKWIPRTKDSKRVFDAKSKPAKFSGGEQRLLSVLSIIATRSEAGLIIIDEPLNNLDFENARNVSNLLNGVIRNNPKTAMLMVSHCRIFPFITKEIRLTANGIEELSGPYVCHSCVGEPDGLGFYTD